MRTMLRTDPNAVLAFVAVVEHGSFREAARTLGIPRSTLSQRVATLETQLGARLLARTTRSVTLTDIGSNYHREVAPAVEALEAAEGIVRDLGRRPSGRVRMTAPIELGQFLFGPVLGNYVNRYPDVRVEVVLVDRQVNLVEEGYDLAIRVGPLADSGLIVRRIGPPQRLGIYGSPQYLKKAGIPRTPRDLGQHRCLAMSGAQTWNKWAFMDKRRTIHIDIDPIVAVNSFRVLTDLVAAGAGLARLARRFAGPLVERGQAREVLAPYAMPPRETFIVYPSARHVSPAVRAMIEVLSDVAMSPEYPVLPEPPSERKQRASRRNQQKSVGKNTRLS